MPGARITERTDERHYKGTVTVRFGPASLTFRGEVELAAIDPVSRTLRLIGKGTDSGGGSSTALDLTASVAAVDAATCTLVGRSELSVSGRAATFGARMADAVAEQVLRQFGANFCAELTSRAYPAGSAPGGGEGEADTGAAAATPKDTSLNGLALLRAVVGGW